MKKSLSISLLFAMVFALAGTKAQAESAVCVVYELCASGEGTGTLDVSYNLGYDDEINATLVKTGDTITTTGSTYYGTTFNATTQVTSENGGTTGTTTTTSTSNFDGGSSGTETGTYNADSGTDSSSGYLTTNTGSASVQYNLNFSNDTYTGTATLYENGVEVNSKEKTGHY